MTDLLSIMFILGIVVIFSIAGFLMKNTVLIIVSGLGWSLASIYMFQLSAMGDPDFGVFTNGFGYLCVLMAMACFFFSWWSHRKKTIEVINDKTGQGFYTDNDPDYKEFEEMYKARSNRKKIRGR
jgi:hypothetical protein